DHDPDAPAVPAPPQDLPVLRRQRAQDRLQGRAAAAALRLGARQDRSIAHYCRFGTEAARARPRHQARALHRHHALRGAVGTRFEAAGTPAAALLREMLGWWMVRRL